MTSQAIAAIKPARTLPVLDASGFTRWLKGTVTTLRALPVCWQSQGCHAMQTGTQNSPGESGMTIR